jgi:hypothetical protein
MDPHKSYAVKPSAPAHSLGNDIVSVVVVVIVVG